jgi:predicted nucleic acid-binding protein
MDVGQLADNNYPMQLRGVYPLLQQADAETVALALEITPDYLIMDEQRGWEAAQDVCGGTTTKIISLHWLLDEAEVQGFISSARALYTQMVNGYAYATAQDPLAAFMAHRQAGRRGLP